MWVGLGRPFGQVAIFLLFQEFSKAFEPSPVKITWSEDCPPSSFLEEQNQSIVYPNETLMGVFPFGHPP